MRVAGATRETAAALLVAALGAWIATLAGLPAAVLIGSTVAVALAALAGLPVSILGGLRDASFALLGVTLGAAVTPDIASEVARWPLSLTILPLSLAATTAAAIVALKLATDLGGQTLFLATSPGALSLALAVSEDRGLDTRTIMVLQSVRLFMVTTVLTPLVAAISGVGAHHSASKAAAGAGETALLFVLACALGWLFSRIRLPAAWLFGGLAVSLALHATGLAEGRPHPLAVAVAFAVIGAVIGARFAKVERRALLQLVGAGMIATVAAVGMSGAFAWPVAKALSLPFGQVWVAYAPGGVEAMAAIGIALGYDPVYVALHHVARLLILSFALPILTRRSH